MPLRHERAQIPPLALLFIVGEHQSWVKSFGHYGVGDVVRRATDRGA